MSKQDGSNRLTTGTDVDDSTATILHIDMDAFFASVELLDHPELVHLPVVIGHRSGRSVVTAANYVARKYGVNSAMPMSIALRRCPEAIVLEPHMGRYSAVSKQVMGIFFDMTPMVEPLSIDEAFLDVAGARRLHGSPAEIARKIRARVYAETGLTCSVGAASTKFVAKLASSRAKPDGLLVIPHEQTISFLHPLPVSALWGVGATTEQALLAIGLRHVRDIAHATRETLERAVGVAGAQKLHDLSWGRDPRTMTSPTRPGCAANCCARRMLSRRNCVATASWPAPSSSNCGTRTSAPSPDPAPWPIRRTWAGVSTKRSPRVSTCSRPGASGCV
jgi:DNA polymerase-4